MGNNLSQEFNPDSSFKPWGPFIPKSFKVEHISRSDIIIASIVWALTCGTSIIAVYLGYHQTNTSRSPLRSTYVWMIWLELLASFMMGIEGYLHLLKIIKPMFWWCIQVQLLLQIIINRIRLIVPDRRRSQQIMIVTAGIVTVINISVFTIWIPARLQTSKTYINVNRVWDRIEKVLYLLIDGCLNWYFVRTVKENLIKNGLEKYMKVLRFNQRMIVISLVMDVMIIAAMSIPNSFVYIQFHPLAYIVKLNIEMVMANLIKRIAVSKSHRAGNVGLVEEFVSSSNKSSGIKSSSAGKSMARASYIELSEKLFPGRAKTASRKHNPTVAVAAGGASENADHVGRVISFAPKGMQIQQTMEITVVREPLELVDRDNGGASQAQGTFITGGGMVEGKSVDNVTERSESVKSMIEGQRQLGEDSDDEAVLVSHKGHYGRARQRDS